MFIENYDGVTPIKHRELTNDDIDMLQYFWEEKGNIERYCDYENIYNSLLEKRPDIIKAWEKYKKSIETLNNIF